MSAPYFSVGEVVGSALRTIFPPVKHLHSANATAIASTFSPSHHEHRVGWTYPPTIFPRPQTR